ncbi:helix-turn-helix transcriptional regulator [Stenotrophomonas mori]|uniref:Helix-turn-helix transcriptional regulator n=1 Tax=Stenotrophomonas mori TaxID=2871096 RepID=A0ABT0SHE5_9GAMM|nr:helix-turn-helix transcriptional regulator [Stenotrophomonas mori]MCL7714737.1 helix-turn-helix transcriptional regulator [Stenotrophomonas mori]
MLVRERDIPIGFGPNPLEARAEALKALDMHSLWNACVDLISYFLPCHSCTLMYDIHHGYLPQKGLHFLGEMPEGSELPARSLDVAAPYLAKNPRIHWYTLSQIASDDAGAHQRLQAQNPAPGWEEFIHLAFWRDDALDAVLSIRMRLGHERLNELQNSFLGELHQLMGAGLQRVHSLQNERRTLFQSLLERQVLPDIILDHELHPISFSPALRQLCGEWLNFDDRHEVLPEAIAVPLHTWLTHANEQGIDSGLQLRHPSQPDMELHITLEGQLLVHPGQPMYLLRIARSPASTALRGPKAWVKLSPSERRVAELVVQGLRNEEIANHLGRSRKTIESQISAIYRKLDVGHRAQLVRLLSPVC